MGMSRWMKRNNRKKDEDPVLTMSDIVRGMQFCVNSGVEIAEQHYRTTLAKYFDESGHPIVQTVAIDDQRVIDVPVVCMTHHNYMALDELTLKMGVVVRAIDKKSALTDYKGRENAFEVSRACFDVDVAAPKTDKDGNTYMDVEMKFKAATPPEAVSRMIEKLNNTIAVSANDKS